MMKHLNLKLQQNPEKKKKKTIDTNNYYYSPSKLNNLFELRWIYSGQKFESSFPYMEHVKMLYRSYFKQGTKKKECLWACIL